MKQRNVSKGGGSRVSKCGEERQLPQRGSQQIRAAHYLRDAHEGVIYHDRQLVGYDTVRAQHHKIAAATGRGATLPARNLIGKGECRLRYMKSERRGASLGRQSPALPLGKSKTRPRVALTFIWCLRRAGDARQLGARAEAWVNEPTRLQAAYRGSVKVLARRLKVRSIAAAAPRSLVEFETQPPEIVNDAGGRSGTHSRKVEVFDPKDETSPTASRHQPGQESGPQVAQVLRSSG